MNGTQLAFNIGDLVREHEGRHIGEVLAQFEWTVRVRWLDNGWKEDLDVDQLALVAKRPPPISRARPRTEVESPKAQLERWMQKKAAQDFASLRSS